MILHFGRDVLDVCPQKVYWLSMGGLLQNAFFLYLFSVMYVRAYGKPSREARD